MKEDIKVLEEFINNYKLIQEKYKDDEIQAEIERSCYFEEVPAKAIENLIARYKELEEENKYLKEQIPVDKIFYYSYKDYIPKSKVREKIEELDDIESDYSKKIIEAPTGLVTGVVQYAFKELLQEGNKIEQPKGNTMFICTKYDGCKLQEGDDK